MPRMREAEPGLLAKNFPFGRHSRRGSPQIFALRFLNSQEDFDRILAIVKLVVGAEAYNRPVAETSYAPPIAFFRIALVLGAEHAG